MVKIKICGIRRIEDIEMINEIMNENKEKSCIDYVGFVFAKSKRKIDIDLAYKCREKLDKSIKTVGVFVNASIAEIKKITERKIIDIVQLHGDEDNYYIEKLKNNIDNPIIKAFRIKDSNDIIDIKECISDKVLLDSYSEKKYGGTNERFDWKILNQVERPYFLAGGINKDNINEAMSRKPYCVDISSGVEKNGFKEKSKIVELLNEIRKEF